MEELRFEDDVLIDRFNEGIEEKEVNLDSDYKENIDYELDVLHSIDIL